VLGGHHHANECTDTHHLLPPRARPDTWSDEDDAARAADATSAGARAD
jgi:hypothetical protein